MAARVFVAEPVEKDLQFVRVAVNVSDEVELLGCHHGDKIQETGSLRNSRI
jgi:hypothetical protein